MCQMAAGGEFGASAKSWRRRHSLDWICGRNSSITHDPLFWLGQVTTVAAYQDMPLLLGREGRLYVAKSFGRAHAPCLSFLRPRKVVQVVIQVVAQGSLL